MTISKLFDKCIQNIGVEHDNVLLFTSDTSPYMVKGVNSLKALNSKMIHIKCMGHGSWFS